MHVYALNNLCVFSMISNFIGCIYCVRALHCTNEVLVIIIIQFIMCGSAWVYIKILVHISYTRFVG